MAHIEITTYIDCPNKCSYCPQETLINTYKGKKQMDLDDFKKILKNIPSNVDVHFSGFSELFFHPNAVDFLLEANKSHNVVVYTTTRGMSDLQIEQIKNIPFKQFVVHDIGNPKQIPFNHEEIKIDTSNKISRGGHLWKREDSEGTHCKKSAGYEQNVVLPNGDVYLCCMDYGLEHKLGNLFETYFNDLNRTEKYNLCKKCEWYV